MRKASVERRQLEAGGNSGDPGRLPGGLQGHGCLAFKGSGDVPVRDRRDISALHGRLGDQLLGALGVVQVGALAVAIAGRARRDEAGSGKGHTFLDDVADRRPVRGAGQGLPQQDAVDGVRRAENGIVHVDADEGHAQLWPEDRRPCAGGHLRIALGSADLSLGHLRHVQSAGPELPPHRRRARDDGELDAVNVAGMARIPVGRVAHQVYADPRRPRLHQIRTRADRPAGVQLRSHRVDVVHRRDGRDRGP